MKIVTLVFNVSLITCFLITASLFGQTSVDGKDIIGVWKTIDDENGRTKAQVEIYKKKEKYCGWKMKTP